MSIKTILRHYDQVMYSSLYKEYYKDSNFFNFGYWLNDTSNQKEASENLLEQLLKMSENKNGSILDVACGMGATTKQLLKYYKPKEVIGINRSIKQLETCKTYVSACQFMLMDATHIAFKNNFFDNIICVEAAFHFDTRFDFIKEAYRILKPGGCLILSDVLLNPLLKLGNEYVPVDNLVKNIDEYRELYLKVGFENIIIVDATKECWEGWRSYITRWLCKKFLFRKIKYGVFASVMLGPIFGTPIIKKYLLVSAIK